MVPEAPLERTEAGLAPRGDGWFVVNARDARWQEDAFGVFTRFEGEPRFSQVGINVSVIQPGSPTCMYHRESTQEDFLVLAGECLLLVEGEERLLRAWDFVHSPPWTDHVFVGAGDGPCIILAVGARPDDEVVYPVAEVALRHGAGVEKETSDPAEAYAKYGRSKPTPYRDGWLPDFG
jgi:uncharacterized cupin superfamily protein